MSTTHNNKVISAFHTSLYFILLVGGVFASALATALIIERTLANTIAQNLAFGTLTGLVKKVLYAFLVGNALHLILIYIDLLLMERNPEKYDSNFPQWFNTKLEIFLRLVALALLILAISGKVVPLMDALFSDPSSNWKMWAFIRGNIALFLTLIVWDLMAVIRQRKPLAERRWRVGAYLISDLIALLCWLLILSSVNDNRIRPSLAALLFFVSIVYLALMIFRSATLLLSLRRTPDTTVPPAILIKDAKTV